MCKIFLENLQKKLSKKPYVEQGVHQILCFFEDFKYIPDYGLSRISLSVHWTYAWTVR